MPINIFHNALIHNATDCHVNPLRTLAYEFSYEKISVFLRVDLAYCRQGC